MSTFRPLSLEPEPCPLEQLADEAPTPEVLETLTAPSVLETLTAPVVGRITGFEGGRFMVTFEGACESPTEARSTVPLSAVQRCRAAEQRAEVLLVFERGDPGRPIVVGLLQPDVAMLDLVLQDDEEREASLPNLAVSVDGESQRIEAKDELVLQCGEASITLRNNGKIVLRGTYIESHAQGTNRIKGGTVCIN